MSFIGDDTGRNGNIKKLTKNMKLWVSFFGRCVWGVLVSFVWCLLRFVFVSCSGLYIEAYKLDLAWHAFKAIARKYENNHFDDGAGCAGGAVAFSGFYTIRN